MGKREVILGTVKAPELFYNVSPIFLEDQTIEERKHKVLMAMKEGNFDTLIIYADKEHAGNFEYLTGFIPRFEEGILIIDKTGESSIILGNENLKMAAHSRIPVSLKHSPLLSLPNQPMDNELPLEDLFKEVGLDKKEKIGLVGWKMFTTENSDPSTIFDIPYFIVEAVKNTISNNTELVNATHLFIRGDKGARTTNNANEIAHYEYGANLSSTCILNALNAVEIGTTEAALGNILNAEGQANTVVTIAATGQRFEKANLYPTHKKVQLGDPLSMTTAYKGGLSSRTGFVIESESQLPDDQKDYLDRVAKPYFYAISTWLETIKVGILGSELYNKIEENFPKSNYHWHLNPGHLTSDEEWMSSPISADSTQVIKSGMILQIDIIPSIAGYTGVSAEECIAIADEKLQNEIKQQYPELWERITARRNYIKNELHIELTDDVLPLSNTVAYLRPFYLNKNQAFYLK